MALNVAYLSVALTADGTASGFATVPDASLWPLGAQVFISATALPTLVCSVLDRPSTTQVGLKLWTSNANTRANISAYTTAASATLTMPAQTVYTATVDDLISAGALDYISSDGSTIEFHEPGLVDGALTVTGALTASNVSGSNTGDVTLAAVGAVPNANGATLVGQILNLQPASGTQPGVITTGAQTIAGAKTLTGALLAASYGTATAIAMSLNSTLAAGAGPAYILDTTNAITGTLWSLRTATTEKARINAAGDVVAIRDLVAEGGQLISGAGVCTNNNGLAQVIRGQVVDGGTAIAAKIQSVNTLSIAGAKLLSLVNNATEKAYFDLTGALVITGPASAAAGIEVPSGARIFLDGASRSTAITYNSGRVFALGGLNSNGDLIVATDATIGGKINITTGGAAASAGSATLSSGSVTVSTTAVTASSLILVTHKGTGTVGNFGTLYIGTVTAATSFQIKSTNASDNDVVFWQLVN